MSISSLLWLIWDQDEWRDGLFTLSFLIHTLGAAGAAVTGAGTEGTMEGMVEMEEGGTGGAAVGVDVTVLKRGNYNLPYNVFLIISDQR